jgi:CpcD/allophycocyanin linker domain
VSSRTCNEIAGIQFSGEFKIMQSSSIFSGSRLFRYEVKGLRQTLDNDLLDYPFRSSDSVFVTVPYNRMNEEMQRITRMGGTIVNITPMSGEE